MALAHCFGKRLKELRSLKKMTQVELAEACGISVPYLGRVERGHASPSFSVIEKLCLALGTDPANLFLFPQANEDAQTQPDTGSDSEARSFTSAFVSWTAVWKRDVASGKDSWSKSLYRLLGHFSETIAPSIGYFLKHVAQEDKQRVSSTIQSVLEGRMVSDFEFSILRRDGRKRTIIAQTDCFCPPNEQPSTIFAMLMDVTEWRMLQHSLLQHQQELEEHVTERTSDLLQAVREMQDQAEKREAAEQHLRIAQTIMEHSSGILSFVNKNYRYEAVNRSYERLMGRPRKSIKGMYVADLMGNEAFQKHLKPNLDRALRGETVHFHNTVPSPVLGEREMAVSYIPYAEDGEILGVVVTAHDITGVKRAEEALRASEHRLREATEYARVMIARISVPEGSFEYLNSGAEEILGYSLEELYSEPLMVRKFIHPDWLPELESWWEQICSGTFPDSIEFPFIHKSGAVRWTRQFNRHIMDDQGRVVALNFVATDITDSKHAEAELREYRMIAEHSNELMAVLDKDLVFRMANKAYCEHVGRPRKEIIGSSLAQALPAACRKIIEPHLRQALEGGQVSVDMELDKPDGSRHPVEATTFPIPCDPDAKGDQPTRVGLIVRDMAARKAAEEALKESELRHRLLADNVLDVIWTMDLDFSFTYFSPSSQTLLGYTPQEMLALPLEQWMTPQALEVFHTRADKRRELLESGEAEGQTCLELLLLTKAGEPIWTEVTSSVMRDEKGQPIGLVGVTRDISRRKHLEQQKDNIDKLIRHDLKHPLVGVITLPEVLLLSENLSQEDRRLLQTIQESGRKMLRLIDSSLTLHNLEAGDYEVLPHDVDLVRELLQVRGELADICDSRKISLNLKLDGAPLEDAEEDGSAGRIAADAILLPFMLANLLRNAVEAAPQGSEVTVHIHAQDPVRIEVHNQGVVPPEIRERFFDKYVTHGKANGTGLGTYAARLVVQAHGGNIALNTSEDEGTTVSVDLPRQLPLPRGPEDMN